MTAKRILIIEDEKPIRDLIAFGLRRAGYEVKEAEDCREARARIADARPDLMLVDWMLPDMSGLELTRSLKRSKDTEEIPVIMLTARAEEQDKVGGLEGGADDYITKPFSMQELLMRMEVFLRRTKKMHSDKTVTFTIGQLNFSYTDLKLTIGQEVFNLTQKEADLLKFLCEHSNRILKREEVLLNVWGKDDYFLGRSMDVFITKLRKYFKADPQVNLETIHGVGFRFNTPTL